MKVPIEDFSDYLIDENGNCWHVASGNAVKAYYCGKKKKCLYLVKDGQIKYIQVDKAVATAFIPNPNNCKYVHHKNGNPNDNRVENLEWWYSSTFKEPRLTEYKGKIGRSGFPIESVDDNGNVVKYYESLRAANRDGHSASSISRCLRGEIKTFDGLHWRYAEDVRGV